MSGMPILTVGLPVSVETPEEGHGDMNGLNDYPPPPQVQMLVMGDDHRRFRPMSWAAITSFVFTALAALVVALAEWVSTTATSADGDSAAIEYGLLYLSSLGGCVIAVLFSLVAIARCRRTRGLGWAIASLVISGPWLVYIGGWLVYALTAG
jgi:hypothetical protein